MNDTHNVYVYYVASILTYVSWIQMLLQMTALNVTTNAARVSFPTFVNRLSLMIIYSMATTEHPIR